MTEWNAGEYSKRSALQQWVADECLAGLALTGAERVLDVGCGDGKITVEIAQRLPRGSILGIDASAQMIAFARAHFAAPATRNLEFDVGDATCLPYRDEFDLIVSFNALHWVTDQAAALHGIRNALTPSGSALLQFVSQGPRKSLEDVIEEARSAPRWAPYFTGYRKPYVHSTPDEYAALAVQCGLRVERIDTQLKAWDFKTRNGFVDFALVTFVEWTRMLPGVQQVDFIHDVLDRYRLVGDGTAGDAHVFHFYQMRVELQR